MTDNIVSLDPVWDAIAALADRFGVYLGFIFAFYCLLFVLGLLFEMFRRKGGENS